MTSITETLVWPITGEILVWDEDSLDPTARLRDEGFYVMVCKYTSVDWKASFQLKDYPDNITNMYEDSPQAALNALAESLQERRRLLPRRREARQAHTGSVTPLCRLWGGSDW
jgi:hypothetical protein